MDFPRISSAPETREHWFRYGDCCIAVSECYPTEPSFCGDGQKQVLFFLHGRYGVADMWKPLVARLAAHFRCLRVDLPGFGRSFAMRERGLSLLEQAQMVESLVDRFSAPASRAILVGHDVGGALAQLCAVHLRRTVGALVLINSVVLTREMRHLRTGWHCAWARLKLRRLLDGVDARISEEERELLTVAWRSGEGRQGMMQAFRAWEYTWPGPYERQLWRRELGQLAMPVLLLWGRQDPLNPPENADDLMHQFSDAYLFETDDCGHWPCLEKLDWVHLKLREFLFRVGEQRPRWKVAAT